MAKSRAIRVAVVNLGCPKNQVDAEVMLGLLREEGFELSSEPARADVVVVNTCGFIADAKEESIQALLDAVHLKERGKVRRVVATGCLTQRYADQLRGEIPEIDAFVGIGGQHRIVEAVREALAGRGYDAVGTPQAVLPEELPRILSTAPWTAYLKIADGCNRPCAFCAIPSIRGPMISRPPEAVVAEARRLVEGGVRELVLVAQDTSQYGSDLYGAPHLAELLRALARVDGIEWIRPLYYYPTNVGDALIAATAEEAKVCRYMDIPLQHVARSVLRRMHRPGDGEAYLKLIERIRQACPEIALRTTFLIGFPGETEEDFQQLLQFVQEARFDRMGAFIFSPEEGTAAFDLPDAVPAPVARRRFDQLMRVQQRISLERNRELVGQRLRVLVEAAAGPRGRDRVGRSYRDAPEIDGTVILRDSHATPGTFVDATVTDAKPYDLIAS
ncbi:MAG TPA: 30S ribosomal protein S12 methylthiotransferase RimO [Armatimonadetes bacterium]|jgi:ribosomal protein S12 methylthiotransferase|nr:30S ribosomal protein S12 methylthiotransferase RimO [Armatimonadota bacterium]